MQLNHGIHKAIVTDNSDFYLTGKIRVRIQAFYNEPLNFDLSTSFVAANYNNDLMLDSMALVHTPIGGGNNYGLFVLPQINSVGLIQFLGGDIKQPVWMGSFFNPEYNDKNEVFRVNVPNDQPLVEGAGSDGILKGSGDSSAKKKTKGGPGSIVLRTKTTSSPGSGSSADPKKLDFNKQRTENLVVLSEEEIKIIHFSEWKNKGSGQEAGDSADLVQFEEITVGMYKEYGPSGNITKQYPQIDIKVTDKNNNPAAITTTGIKVTSEEVSLEVTSKANKTTSKISSTAKGINISSLNTNTNETTNYAMDPAKVLITNKTVSVVIEAKDVAVSAPEGIVRLSGKEIYLGDGGGYIVVRDAKLPMRMEDGTILKCSNVRA